MQRSSAIVDDPPDLAIKPSYATSLRPCVICGHITEALRGPELYMADTDNLVCWTCGLKLAPELMRMPGA